MKTKHTKMNQETGQNEAFIEVSNDEIRFLKEVVNMYDQKRLGDINDPKINQLKAQIKQDLHQAWRELNPS